MKKQKKDYRKHLANYPDLMSREEAAEYIGMTEGFISREIHAKRLTALRLGRFIRIPKTEFEKYLKNLPQE